jgi:hypothetical protein
MVHVNGKPEVPELLRRIHIYSRYFKDCQKYKPKNPEDWAELHVCALKRFADGTVYMYDTQVKKSRLVKGVIDVIPYIPWYHTVCKLKFSQN